MRDANEKTCRYNYIGDCQNRGDNRNRPCYEPGQTVFASTLLKHSARRTKQNESTDKTAADTPSNGLIGRCGYYCGNRQRDQCISTRRKQKVKETISLCLRKATFCTTTQNEYDTAEPGQSNRDLGNSVEQILE